MTFAGRQRARLGHVALVPLRLLRRKMLPPRFDAAKDVVALQSMQYAHSKNDGADERPEQRSDDRATRATRIQSQARCHCCWTETRTRPSPLTHVYITLAENRLPAVGDSSSCRTDESSVLLSRSLRLADSPPLCAAA